MTTNSSISVLVCLFAVGCSGGHASSADVGQFPEAPLTTVSSSSGSLQVEVRTSPDQPPTRGVLGVELTILDATTGKRVPDLSVVVTPWMPAMGHGTSTLPEVSETEPGVYVANPVSAFMPGAWQLRTQISGAVSDYVEPSLPIQ